MFERNVGSLYHRRTPRGALLRYHTPVLVQFGTTLDAGRIGPGVASHREQLCAKR